MEVVCGIDVGSLQSLNYIAWLYERQFILDLYIPTIKKPLPQPPEGLRQPRFMGFDAPQGLPGPGRAIRVADKEAGVPTKRLPANRTQLGIWKLYQGLIRAGVEIFWAVYEQGLASIAGLAHTAQSSTIIFETYPRYVIRRLWPGLDIPSKKREPLAYVDTIWGRIQEAGYSCISVVRPTVDHVDAMLCAIAAEAFLKTGVLPEGTVGLKPEVDLAGKVLREGFIVGP